MKPGTSQKPARAVTLSIFVRCALLIAVATFTVVAVMAMESSKLVREVAVAGVADRAASVNRFLSSQTSGGIRFGKEDAILGVLTSASEMSDGYMSSGLAADRDGTVLATLGADAASARELADLAAAAVETGDRVASPDGLLQADPVVFGPEREVIGAVATAWSADPILASLRDSTMMILAVAGTVFVIALAGSVFVLRKTIAVPLRRVGTAMKAVVGGDLEHTIPETARRDEIGLMARDLEEFRGIMSGVAEAERSREEMRAAQAEVVEALRTGLASLRDGDLSYRIETSLSADYDQLRKDFNTASARLHDAIAEVAEMAGAMRGEVQDIVGAADDLSRRTEQQAATLEETAAAVAEITAAVRSAAEGARQATEVVREARASAESTGGIVGDAVAAMDEISASSDQISKIIGVIDDIAFQTNLLALNAGVEAARAGDAGRGFAVVASEVRALAQRSSEAAREINDLITTSGQHVKSGARLVGQAGDALRQIAASVTGISDHVTEIVTSSQEQSASLSEVNTAMGQLDQVTQQNAAMFEETTAASHALVQQADRLTAGIARFRVTDARAAAPATYASPRDAAATPMPSGPAKAPLRTSGALALDSDPDDWSEF